MTLKAMAALLPDLEEGEEGGGGGGGSSRMVRRRGGSYGLEDLEDE